MTLTFRRAFLVTLGGTLLAALLVGGVTLERRLTAELVEDVRQDLAMAPPLLADRQSTQAETLRMHAQVLSETEALRAALAAGDRAAGVVQAEQLSGEWGEDPVVVESGGEVWVGPRPAPELVTAAASGESPYAVQYADGQLHQVAVAVVRRGEAQIGVAGVALALDARAAEVLAGLTHSEVVLVGRDGAVVASTVPPEVAMAIVAAGVPPTVGGPTGSVEVTDLQIPGAGRYWSTAAPLGEAGVAFFVRSADRELGALPRLRRAALIAGGLALLVTLLVGSAVAAGMSRPVRALAGASRDLAAGDFDAPLPSSRVSEVATVSGAFGEMRRALAARLEELREANAELEDRQTRLPALQTQLIQRDRLVAAGRLVTELAHEIRNPVANVRNCLEVVRRQATDPKAREFTDLAIEELLRMHELAERMLDLNRPLSPGARSCDARTVVGDVVALVELGDRDGQWQITIAGPERLSVAVPPDSLKQVLHNLLTNAQEASPEGGPIEVRLHASDGRVELDISDRGHGISDDAQPRIFDPFFTTKEEVHGVGLGLFIAQGVLRRHGGSITAMNRTPGPGATIRVELPAGHAARAPETFEPSASGTPSKTAERTEPEEGTP
jgi:signal transduction histidine kinase